MFAIPLPSMIPGTIKNPPPIPKNPASNPVNKPIPTNRTAIAGVILGAAILGALASNKEHRDDEQYRDENYYGSRHSSYIPRWMVGTFRGYNPQYGAEVEMRISEDGRVVAETQEHADRYAD